MVTRIFLSAPDEYWQIDDVTRMAVCNGCGTKGLGGWLAPETLYGLSITECCNIHDYMYFKGRDIDDKKRADRTFLNNMLRVVDGASGRWASGLAWPRRRRALKYYEAVKYLGGPAFWQGKHS